MNKKYLIVAGLLFLVTSLSFLFKINKKRRNWKELSFYESSKFVGHSLTKEEHQVLLKFKNENEKCLNSIEDQGKIVVMKNLIEKKISQPSSVKKVHIKISDLESELGFDPRYLIKKISYCNLESKKALSDSEKVNFKSAIKKMKIADKVELYNGVAR